MLFILLLVIAQYVQAQSQSVDEIIDKHLEARGGKDNILAITSVVMEGMRQVDGNDIEFVLTKVQGKLSRTDFTFAGKGGYTILTENAGWLFIPMRSTSPEAMTDERIKSSQPELDITGPLLDYGIKGHKVKLMGKDALDGKDTWKLQVTLNTGKEVMYYIDMQSNLIVRTTASIPGPGGTPLEQVTDFTDYKAVGKVMFPHTVNVIGSGLMSGSTTFDKIALNREIGEKLYLPGE